MGATPICLKHGSARLSWASQCRGGNESRLQADCDLCGAEFVLQGLGCSAAGTR